MGWLAPAFRFTCHFPRPPPCASSGPMDGLAAEWVRQAHTPDGDAVIEHYLHTGRWEQLEYDRRVTDWEVVRNFERA